MIMRKNNDDIEEEEKNDDTEEKEKNYDTGAGLNIEDSWVFFKTVHFQC